MSHTRRCQTSRLGLRGVRSTFMHSASNQTTSAATAGVELARGGGVEAQRAGQEVHAEVRASAGLDELLDLGVGLGAAERGIEVDEDELGDGQAERAGQLPGDDLRHERLDALPRAAELHHVHAVVVGLHDPRQRATLAQWGRVPGRANDAHSRTQSCSSACTCR